MRSASYATVLMLVMWATRSLADNCESLAGQTFDDARVIATETVAAGATLKSHESKTTAAKPLCRARGVIRPTNDSEIQFEVWLPSIEAWNGKYRGVGNGGNAGNPVYGTRST
jgi:feruloyl esterase